MSTMTQCTLRGPQNQIDTRWIESRLAKIGGRLRVKATGEVWIVTEVGTTWPTRRVQDYQQDYTRMPDVTDAHRAADGSWIPPRRPK